ncbi:MAG TPA: VCBS repeat-containing protein [Candidatus Hydrogenedentes bacterium]|nr:VCBS repeat-containing protein [Candidatus Hydrogenedentota bacterium]
MLCLLAAAAAHGQTFEISRAFRVGPNPRAIVAPDLNGDGWPEIITADTGPLGDLREERPANDELSLLIAEGDLKYVKHHPSLKTGFAPYAIAIANIDALRMPDIVVVSFLAVRHRDVTLFRNLPDNLFETIDFRAPDEGLSYYRHLDGDGAPIFTKPGLTALAIADVNRDGYRDLIATAWSSDALVLFPGDPQLYFGAPQYLPAPGGPRDVQIADFDCDGNLDLAVVFHTTGEIGLWRGDGQGAFDPISRFLTRGRLPNRIRVADINQDGVADLAVSHGHTDDSIVVFHGDGGFQFSVSQELTLGKDRALLEHQIEDLVVEDLTGDMRPDLAAACYESRSVIVMINQSTSTARAQEFRREVYTLKEGRPRALCTGDFNRDGKIDLAVATWEPDTVTLLLAR